MGKLATLVALFSVAVAEPASATNYIFDGTYTSTTVMGAYTHTETDVVSGLQVTGEHIFTGPGAGSFEWTGTITLETTPIDLGNGNSEIASITGSGVIDNLGIRPFTLTAGGIIENGDQFTLFWLGTDPVYGGIGGEAYFSAANFSAAAPEPSTWAMLLAGFAALGFAGLSRRRGIVNARVAAPASQS